MQKKLSKPPNKIFITKTEEKSFKSFCKSNVGWFFIISSFAFIPFIPIFTTISNRYNLSNFAKIFISWTNAWKIEDSDNYVYQYFKSLTPILYQAILRVSFLIGITPYNFITYIIAPISLILLALITFLILKKIYGRSYIAFICSTLITLIASFDGKILEGSPKAVAITFLFGFFYGLISKNSVIIVATFVIISLLYPPFSLFCIILFILNNINFKHFFSTRKISNEHFLALTLLTLFFVSGYIYYQPISSFGEIPFLHHAKDIKVLNKGYLFSFFDSNLISFFLLNSKSSFLGGFGANFGFWGSIIVLYIIILSNISIKHCITNNLKIFLPETSIILYNILIACFFTYVICSLCLFKLYYPSSVSSIILLLTTPISVILLFADKIDKFVIKTSKIKSISALLIFCIFSISLITYAGYKNANNRVFSTEETDLYNFIKTTDEEAVIVGLIPEISNIETLTYRKTFGSKHHLIPFNRDYYSYTYNRANILANALLHPQKKGLDIFISKYNISYILLSNDYKKTGELLWLKNLNIKQNLQKPALFNYIDKCTSFKNNTFLMVNAKCVLRTAINVNNKTKKRTRRRTPFVVK